MPKQLAKQIQELSSSCTLETILNNDLYILERGKGMNGQEYTIMYLVIETHYG